MTATRSELAAAIRRLNARIFQLSPEGQREIQPDWNASWAELQRQREKARTRDQELGALDDWVTHWIERLEP
jgi:hypothetical protein